MSPAVRLAVALALHGAMTSGALAQGQPAAPAQGTETVRSRVRFEGATLLRADPTAAAPTDSVRVDIRQWSIAGGQRVARLDVPLRGLMIVELRGGRVTTIIDGQRVERRVGEIWSVPPGSTMQLETGDDMATLQTTVIGG